MKFCSEKGGLLTKLMIPKISPTINLQKNQNLLITSNFDNH